MAIFATIFRSFGLSGNTGPKDEKLPAYVKKFVLFER